MSETAYTPPTAVLAISPLLRRNCSALAQVFRWLNRQGLRRALLCGNAAELAALDATASEDLELSRHTVPDPGNTETLLRLAAETAGRVLFLSGETLPGLSIKDLELFCNETGGHGAAALLPAAGATTRSGSLFDSDCRCTLGSVNAAGRDWRDAGAYLLSETALRRLAAGADWDTLRRSLHAYPTLAPHLDMLAPPAPEAVAAFLSEWSSSAPTWVGLDRDGTLIENVPYLSDPKRATLMPGSAAALDRLRTAGIKLAVISNQSGVARGYCRPDEVELVNRAVAAQLRADGAEIDGWYWCPHAPDSGCFCRKPAAGLLRRFACDFGLDLSRGVIIGDNDCDILLGARAGLRAVLVGTGHASALPPEIRALAAACRPDLAAACAAVLEWTRQK